MNWLNKAKKYFKDMKELLWDSLNTRGKDHVKKILMCLLFGISFGLAGTIYIFNCLSWKEIGFWLLLTIPAAYFNYLATWNINRIDKYVD